METKIIDALFVLTGSSYISAELNQRPSVSLIYGYSYVIAKLTSVMNVMASPTSSGAALVGMVADKGDGAEPGGVWAIGSLAEKLVN